MFSKILRKTSAFFTQRKTKMSERRPDLPEYADDYTPEKVKLKEDIQKIFPKGPYHPASIDELLPKGGKLLSGYKVFYVKRGEIIIKIKNESYLGICILRKNCYALIPKGELWVENLSKRSNSLYCFISPRPITETYEEISHEKMDELIEKDIKAFNQEFPGARRITPLIEKFGTLPGIDAVTK